MDTSMVTPRSRTFLRYALALIAAIPIALTAPAGLAATPPGGGGSHFSGGGGHSFSGGGHSSAPSPHFAAGGGHGYAPVAAPHFATPNFASAPAYGGHSPYYPHPTSAGAYGSNHYVAPYGHSGYVHGGSVAPGGYYARGIPGRYIPGQSFNYHYWHGGYWHGGFWPGIYWGGNFAWFLPAIPAFAAVYWWNSVPYYYCDNVYYTYDPSQSGYVVTAPPPAADAPDASYADANANDASSASQQDGSANNTSTDPGIGNLYAYPKNGQSDEQQRSDRQECAQWASGQASADGTGSAMDYQRALTACLQGRGYSVD